MNELCIQEKMKMDSVITFCNLMENYSQDPNVKLPDFPSIISNYLKGVSHSISMTSPRSPEVLLKKQASTTGTRLLQSKEGIYDGSMKILEKNLGDLKGDMDVLKTAITKIMQSSDQNALRVVEQESRSPSRDSHHDDHKRAEKHKDSEKQQELERSKEVERQKELEKHREIEKVKEQEKNRIRKDSKEDSDKKKKQSTVNTGRGRLFVGSSFYLAQAVQNSNSVLWNLKKGSN